VNERRRLVALVLILLAIAGPVSANASTFRVYLLGTGGPELTPERSGAATLIEVGGQLLLFDAGRGVVQRLYQARINPKRVTRIFLTHLHSDHIDGLPELWMTPWFLLGRSLPLDLHGPEGTRALVVGMRAMYAHDVASRANAFNPASALDIRVTETRGGVVQNEAGVRVTAIPVDHADGNPAFAYRIDHEGRSILLSGDTTYDPRLVAAARGVDLIVHNVVAFSPRLSALPEMQGVLAKLTTPEQAARVFVEARPRLAIFSHIVKKELPGRAGDRLILNRTRKAGYSGPLAMGRDGMTIDIGDRIRIMPPRHGRLPDLDGKAADFVP
jgi:ribonuclease Z